MKPVTKDFTFWSRWRHTVQSVVLALYFLLPQPLPVRGFENGALHIDLAKGTLTCFGETFTRSHFYLVLMNVVLIYLLALVLPMILNKVFCGWICPQNIFFEMFASVQKTLKKYFPWFRKQPQAQKAVDGSLAIFFGALIAGNILRYISGIDPLYAAVIFSGIFLFFVYDTHILKHKFCESACPYALMQKSVTSKTALHVQYENRPGSPCNVCQACVKACYVNLDIKKDTYHIDCTNCGACIDACNRVFSRKEAPALLEFSFQDKETKKPPNFLKWGFAIFCAFGFSALSVACAIYRPMEKIQLSAVFDAPNVNRYTLKVQNLGVDPATYRIHSKDPAFAMDPVEFQVDGLKRKELQFLLYLKTPQESSMPFHTVDFEMEKKGGWKRQERRYFYLR